MPWALKTFVITSLICCDLSAGAGIKSSVNWESCSWSADWNLTFVRLQHFLAKWTILSDSSDWAYSLGLISKEIISTVPKFKWKQTWTHKLGRNVFYLMARATFNNFSNIINELCKQQRIIAKFFLSLAKNGLSNLDSRDMCINRGNVEVAVLQWDFGKQLFVAKGLFF